MILMVTKDEFLFQGVAHLFNNENVIRLETIADITRHATDADNNLQPAPLRVTMPEPRHNTNNTTESKETGKDRGYSKQTKFWRSNKQVSHHHISKADQDPRYDRPKIMSPIFYHDRN